jgi:hypothetical protein
VSTRLERWWFAPAPAARLALFRLAVGTYAAVWSAVRLPAHLGLADRPAARWDPVGPWSLVDAPPPSAVTIVLAVGAPMVGAAVATGRWQRVAGPVGALWFLALTALASSWGQIFHTENLLVLHLAVLAVAPAAGIDDIRRERRARGPAEDRFGWPLRLASVLVVATYVLAGVAKLRIGGGAWLDGEVLRNLVAHDNLRKSVLGDAYSPIGRALVAHAWVFGPLAWVSLLVELGAPVALLGGRWRTAWIAAAWTFHVGVLALMAVVFPYQLLGVAFLPFLPLERALRYSDREDARDHEVDGADEREGGDEAGQALPQRAG